MRTLLAFVALTLAATACGGEPLVELSPTAAEGRRLVNDSGCAACHGKNGQGVTAPSWQGLYDGPVELQDGTTVTADEDYLRRAILDPQAEISAGAKSKMPAYTFDDDQLDLIMAYIRELK